MENSITLWDAHISTLADLQKIAKDNGCSIAIGFRTNGEEDFSGDEETLLEELCLEKDTDLSKEFIEVYHDVNKAVSNSETYWFELHGKSGELLGAMVVWNKLAYNGLEYNTHSEGDRKYLVASLKLDIALDKSVNDELMCVFNPRANTHEIYVKGK